MFVPLIVQTRRLLTLDFTDMIANIFKLQLICLGMAAILLPSCSIVLTDERGDQLEIYDYYVDSNGNEGIVVYANSSRIIVMSLDEAELSWGPQDNQVFALQDKDLLTRNTFSLSMQYAMIEAGLDQFAAQAWCQKKNPNGAVEMGNWRLPSYYDWDRCIMWKSDKNRHLKQLNKFLKLYGGKELSEQDYYWTCTEDYDEYFVFNDTTLVYDFDASNRAIAITPMLLASIEKDRWVKRNRYKVRAIKYVYYKD